MTQTMGKYRKKLCQEIDTLAALHQQTLPKPWPQQKPIVIQFPINDICNARCQMCHIWQRKQDHEVTPDELRAILANPLFSDVQTVGVNGGEPTLRKDLPDLVQVIFETLPSIRSISIITNGLKSDMVISRLGAVGQIVRHYGGFLDVMVSLDGMGEVHDRVRGRPENFANAVRVIDFIQSSDLFAGRRLGCTIIKENVYGLHDLLEFALAHDIYIKYRVGIPHQRLYTSQVVEPFALSFAERCHIAVFLKNLCLHYEQSEAQRDFYHSLVGQLIYNHPRDAGCDWQHRGVTLTSRGDLLYCAVASKTLGSALREDAEQLYYGNQDHLEEIVNHQCDSCLHDYVGIPRITRQAAARVYARRWLQRAHNRVPCLSRVVRSIPHTLGRLLDPLQPHQRYSEHLRRLGLGLEAPQQLRPAARLRRRDGGRHKVLICGWYGTETLGDKAILGGVLHVLRDILPNLELHIASLEVFISRLTAEQMPELAGCNIYSLAEALQRVSEMDLVLCGGGPLMSSIHYLAEMRALFERASQAGIPTITAGCGVGPIHPFSPYIRSICHILQLSSARIFRDEASRIAARRIGVDTSYDSVAEDPAFTWLQAQATQNGGALPAERSAAPRLLLGLRDWTYHEYGVALTAAEGQQIKTRTEQTIIEALKQLLARHPDLIIVPFPMCTNHIGGDDRWFYRRLFRDQPALQQAIDPTFLGAEISPLEAVQAFHSSSAALVMRYHAMIFALGLDLPVVSIDYTLGHGKTSALARKHSVPHQNMSVLETSFLVAQLSTYLAEPQLTRSRPIIEPEFGTALRAELTRLIGSGAAAPHEALTP